MQYTNHDVFENVKGYNAVNCISKGHDNELFFLRKLSFGLLGKSSFDEAKCLKLAIYIISENDDLMIIIMWCWGS